MDLKAKITRDEALKKLRELPDIDRDEEVIHVKADNVLLDLIGDPEIREAWEALPKWFA